MLVELLFEDELTATLGMRESSIDVRTSVDVAVLVVDVTSEMRLIEGVGRLEILEMGAGKIGIRCVWLGIELVCEQ